MEAIFEVFHTMEARFPWVEAIPPPLPGSFFPSLSARGLAGAGQTGRKGWRFTPARR